MKTQPRPSLRFLKAGAWLAALGAACHAPGAEPPSEPSSEEMKSLSLDDLLAMKVTSVSKKPERAFNAASAIYVMPAEEIHRSPALTLPELLRYVPGLHVARFNPGSYAISARGFNNSAANKMEILMDGRSLYTPLFSGVFWDVQDTMLDDLDRVEVIRGPGAAVWGANAVNGVINFISKDSRETQGLLINGGGGSEMRGFGGVRYGGQISDDAFYRVYVKYFREDEMHRPNGLNGENQRDFWQGGFRTDWQPNDPNHLTLQGDIYYGLAGLFGANAQGDFDDLITSGGNVISRWSHDFAEDNVMTLQAYYDRSARKVEPQFGEHRDTFDFDGQHRFTIGDRQSVVWGLGYRMTRDRTDDIGNTFFVPKSREAHLFSAFWNHEIFLFPDRLSATIGSKFEHNDYTGFEIQPSARLAWTPTESQTVWGAVSRAVRTPTRSESDIFIRSAFPLSLFAPVNLRGNPNFQSETVIAYELGYRIQPVEPLALDAALFYNDYDDLRSFEPTPGGFFGLPLVISNKLRGQSYGVEFTGTYQALEWWKLIAGYTYMQVGMQSKNGGNDQFAFALEGNDPHHVLTLRSYMDLPAHFQFDSFLRYISAYTFSRHDRTFGAGASVPGYMELELRLAWTPVKNLELAVVGQNLLSPAHVEHGQPTPINEAERGVYGKVTFKY